MNVKSGQTVTCHYVGKLEDGTTFDSSYALEKPLSFKFGQGQLISGFESAITELSVGEKKTFTFAPAQAYGERVDEAIRVVPRNQFKQTDGLDIGSLVEGQSPDGRPLRATVHSLDDEAISLDFNHPLAGKELTFEIELLSVE